jgi:hypothetical protein
MSEFVECQNCGRTFFAENLECPYCRGGSEQPDDREPPSRPGGGTVYGVLFAGFMLVLAGFVALSLVSLMGVASLPGRLFYALEGCLALLTLWGLAQRRRWGRTLAILFILMNATLGILSLWAVGRAESLAWGPGPAALLLFLVPFFSPQARQRYCR